MVQLTKVYEQEMKSKIPIRVSQTASVSGDKSMMTMATLGKLIVAVDIDCVPWYGLWGRVLFVVSDGDGNASGVTNVLLVVVLSTFSLLLERTCFTYNSQCISRGKR